MVTNNEAGEAAYEKSIRSPKPLDPVAAAETLKDVKRILDQLGVVFFLASGTCLGAIRENRFIPWDDEMDTACVIGLHGFIEEMIDRVIDAFTENGYYVHIDRTARSVGISVVKSSIRVDWTRFRIIGDSIVQYPAVKTPVRLFTQLKEFDFIGEKFLVPNPPEEYLRIKYGPDWRTPKAAGSRKTLCRTSRTLTSLTVGEGLLNSSPNTSSRGAPADSGSSTVRGSRCMARRSLSPEWVVPGPTGRGMRGSMCPMNTYYAVIVRYDGQEEVI